MRTHRIAVVLLGFLGGSPAGALASQSDEPSDSPEVFSAIPAFSTDHILKRGDWLVGYACSRIVLFALLLGFIAVSSSAAFAASRDKEYRLKAAYVLSFASLIEWPSESFGDSEDPIVMCAVTSSETKSLLDTAYSGQMVGHRSIELRHLSSSGMVSGCHIVFITAERGEQVREFISAVIGKSILTIGDTYNFARSGGVIGFYRDGPNIRFEINLRAAESAKLRIGSQLIQLARPVSSEADVP